MTTLIENKGKYFGTLSQEAQMLSMYIGLRKEACAKWLKHERLRGVLDLMQRYPDRPLRGECIARAAQEIENFILGLT